MATRRITDDEGHAHFLTFSCYHPRRRLDAPQAKRVVLGVLRSQLALQNGQCAGFVGMPNHVHAIVWFPAPDELSHFMKQWKQRSSVQIKRLTDAQHPGYTQTFERQEPVWQPGYYDFILWSDSKLAEKLTYMYQNPVRAGLVQNSCDWPWSSARYYEQGRSVGVPVGWLDRPDSSTSGDPE